jgi:hypothetical protein
MEIRAVENSLRTHYKFDAIIPIRHSESQISEIIFVILSLVGLITLLPVVGLTGGSGEKDPFWFFTLWDQKLFFLIQDFD